MSTVDQKEMQANNIFIAPNAHDRIVGLLTDIEALQRDLQVANELIDAVRKDSRAKFDEVVKERNETVSALQTQLLPLKQTNKDMQKEIFWLREQYDNLIDKLMARGGTND